MTEALFWFAVVGIFAFPIAYTVLAKWWRTSQGWYNMSLSLALVALASLGVLPRLIGENYIGREEFRNVTYAFVGLVLWWRLGFLLRVQFVERRRVRRLRSDTSG
jgi:hypothetical protein